MKQMNKTKKDYVALLTIPEFPKTESSKKRLVEWLRQTAKVISKEKDYKVYATPCRFRLMK